LAVEVQAAHGRRIRARIGVHSGEVVASDPAALHGFVTGDAVNVAARLEQGAAAGEILLSADTFRLVRDAVEVGNVTRLRAKGKPEPLAAYALRRVSADRRGIARRHDFALVGRTAELERLHRELHEAVCSGSPRLVRVLGEAGLGKSRMLAEFAQQVEASATVLFGACLSYGAGMTYRPVVQAVRQSAGIAEHDRADEAEAKLAAIMHRARNDPSDPCAKRGVQVSAGVLAGLLGLRSVPTLAQSLSRAAADWLEALGECGPVVLVLDDLHWAEDDLFELIDSLTAHTRGPALILASARPEVAERWLSSNTPAPDLRLMPLDTTEGLGLIAAVLSGPVADALARRVVTLAGGNPLFVAQLTSSLVEQGRLQRDGGRWVATHGLQALTTPPDIHALLAARVDRVPTEERAALEVASVVGERFWSEAARAIRGEDDEERFGLLLAALAARQLIRRREGSDRGAEDWEFTHALIRDVVYAGVLKRQRATWHEQTAAWLEDRFRLRNRTDHALIGYHLEQACHGQRSLSAVPATSDSLGSKAADHLAAAAQDEVLRTAQAPAADLMRRALAVDGRRDELWVQRSNALVTMLIDTGQLDDAIALSEDTATRAAELRDEAGAIRAEALRWWIRLESAPLTGVLEAAEALATRATRLRDPRASCVAYNLLSQVAGLGGDVALSSSASRRALDAARAAGDPVDYAEALVNHATSLTAIPAGVAAAVEEIEAIRGEMETLSPSGVDLVAPAEAFLAGLGEARDTVIDELAKAARRRTESKSPTLAGVCYRYRAYLESIAGDPVRAENTLRESNWPWDISYLASLIAEQPGRGAEALEFLERQPDRRAPKCPGPALRARSDALTDIGDAEQAEPLAEEALRRARHGRDSLEEAASWLTLARVASARRRPDKARAARLATLEAYERAGVTLGARRVRALLEAPRGRAT
ncbi:MAG: hypothetical protein QOH13_2373, partial [Thermoleophilaceae bacterium]|nr:hypothetical protein [Thermoleophilaceae bacterium]